MGVGYSSSQGTGDRHGHGIMDMGTSEAVTETDLDCDYHHVEKIAEGGIVASTRSCPNGVD